MKKTFSLANILIFLGMVSILTNILQKPFGWPDWTGFVLPFIGVGLIWSGVLLVRRAKKLGDSSIISPSPQQYKKRIRLMLVIGVVTSLTGPFWLPYTGVTLPFDMMVICSLVGCALYAGMLVLLARQNQPMPKQSCPANAAQEAVTEL
jgi:hypothetical protein